MTTSFLTDRTQFILAYPFRDPKWAKKLGIGILVLLSAFIIPLLPYLVLYGYVGRIVRSAAAGEDDSLPEWNDLGGLMGEGLRIFGALIIYALPMLVFMIAGWLVFMVVAFMPLISIGLSGSGGNDSMAGGLFVLMMAGYGVGFLLMSVGLALTIVLGTFQPAILGHVATQQRFGAAFKVGEWWKLFWANWSGFLLSFVLLYGLFGIIYMVYMILYFTVILCWLMPLVLLPGGIYGLVVWAAMVGRAYGTAREKLAAAQAPVAAAE